MPYQHLSEPERYVICHLHRYGLSHAQIGRRLNRHRGTIGRELGRNRDPYSTPDHNDYFYDTSQRLTHERRDRANRRYKLDDTPLGQSVRQGLQQRWSPQQIAERLKRDHPHDPDMRITHETIYRWGYRRCAAGEPWHEQQRRRHRKRRRRCARRTRRGLIPGRVGIEQRPAVVGRRSRFGDWEADTIQGAKSRGAVTTHVERKNRYVLARKLADQRARTFTRATLKAFETIPDELRKTLTCDNGNEFAQFKHIQRC